MIPYRDNFPDIFSKAEQSTLDGAQLRLLLLAEICDTKDEMIVSTRQIKQLDLLIEQIVVFEISPRLAPGVGLDISKRLKKHDQNVFKMDFNYMKIKFDSLTVADNETNDFKAARELFLVVKNLARIFHSGKQLIAGKLVKITSDIICACLQLGFGRISNGMFASKEIGLAARQIMLKLLDNLPLSKVFKELIQIQSEKSAPHWIKIAVGKVLSRMISRCPDALVGLLEGLLGPEGCLSITSFDQILNISQIILKRPQHIPTNQYFPKLEKELSEIFDSLGSQCVTLSSSQCQLVAILICGCSLENKHFGKKLFYLKENHAKNFRSWNRTICSLPSAAANSIPGFSLISDWVIKFPETSVVSLNFTPLILKTEENFSSSFLIHFALSNLTYTVFFAPLSITE